MFEANFRVTSKNVEEYIIYSQARACFKNNNHQHLLCNKLVSDQLGLTSTKDIINLYDRDLCCSKYAHQYIHNDKFVMKDNVFYDLENSILADGSEVLLYTMKKPVFNNANKIIGVFALALPYFQSKNSHLRHSLKLTIREEECVQHIVNGLSYKQISVRMNLSPRTVEQYADNIKSKAGCQSKYELIDFLMNENPKG